MNTGMHWTVVICITKQRPGNQALHMQWKKNPLHSNCVLH